MLPVSDSSPSTVTCFQTLQIVRTDDTNHSLQQDNTTRLRFNCLYYHKYYFFIFVIRKSVHSLYIPKRSFKPQSLVVPMYVCK